MTTPFSDEETYLIEQRAYELAMQGRYEMAAVLFEGLIAAAPSNLYGRRALAAVQIQMGRPGAALQTLNGIANSEQDPRVRQLRLEALLALGSNQEAGVELSAARPYLDVRAARRFALMIESWPKQLPGRQSDN